MEKMLKDLLVFLEGCRHKHYYCFDCWYTCPEHPDGCCNDEDGDKCNCGANEFNIELDKIISLVKQHLNDCTKLNK